MTKTILTVFSETLCTFRSLQHYAFIVPHQIPHCPIKTSPLCFCDIFVS